MGTSRRDTETGLRVLVVTGGLPTPTNPGSMALVARQIRSLRQTGLRVVILEVKGRRRLKYLCALPHLQTLSSTVDIVHAHYAYCGWVARTQLRRPVVVSFMGDDLLGTPDYAGRMSAGSRLVVKINRVFARTADAVIVKSDEMARVIAPVPAHVVPNGVDLKTFAPMEKQKARACLGWEASDIHVLFPGSPDIPRKNFPLAKDAVREAENRLGRPIKLVPLWGVGSDAVPFYMNACDAQVMTSHSEGSPNAIKEAMACNLPVVSVPVGDVPQLLQGVERSRICPRDPVALGVALAEVLSAGKPSNGRTVLARKRLDQESVAREIIRIYEEVLSGKGR